MDEISLLIRGSLGKASRKLACRWARKNARPLAQRWATTLPGIILDQCESVKSVVEQNLQNEGQMEGKFNHGLPG